MSYQERTINGRLMWCVSGSEEWLPHPLDTQVRHVLGPHNDDAEPVVYLVAGLVAEVERLDNQCKQALCEIRDKNERIAELESKQEWGVEWNPIETAPKSRHSLLLYVPENKCIYCAVWSQWESRWEIFGGDFREHLNRASHWAHIPPAPEAKDE